MRLEPLRQGRRTQLDAATTAEVRVALRAEIRAVKDQLKAGKLSGAEVKALRAQAKALRVALRAKPTKAERATIKTRLKAITTKLACRTEG